MKQRTGTRLPPGYRFIIDPERPGEIIVQRPDGSEMPPQSRRYLATAAAGQDFLAREAARKREGTEAKGK